MVYLGLVAPKLTAGFGETRPTDRHFSDYGDFFESDRDSAANPGLVDPDAENGIAGREASSAERADHLRRRWRGRSRRRGGAAALRAARFRRLDRTVARSRRCRC